MIKLAEKHQCRRPFFNPTVKPFVVATPGHEWAVVKEIGRGSYGSIWETIRGDFAIKFSRGDDPAPEFVAETRALKTLQHPNIARLIDEGACLYDSRSYKFFVMPKYVDIKSWIAETRVGEQFIKKLIRDLFAGLVFLHDAKYIHGDIKPENLLLADVHGTAQTLQPRLVICDFGSLQYKKGTDWVGTMHYMAPEVFMGKSYDNRADVWSATITTLELLYDFTLVDIYCETTDYADDGLQHIVQNLPATPIEDDEVDLPAPLSVKSLRKSVPAETPDDTPKTSKDKKKKHRHSKKKKTEKFKFCKNCSVGDVASSDLTIKIETAAYVWIMCKLYKNAYKKIADFADESVAEIPPETITLEELFHRNGIDHEDKALLSFCRAGLAWNPADRASTRSLLKHVFLSDN